MSDPFDLSQYGGGASPSSGYPGDPYAGTPSGGSDEESRLSVGSPPLLWLVGAAVLAVIGGALAAFVIRSGPATVLPWVLAGPAGIVLLGVYSIVDTRRRALAVYAAGAWVKPLYVAVIVLILAAVVVSALDIALWVGHL